MTSTLSQANSYAPTAKDNTETDARSTPKRNVWAVIAKRFWDYTEATGEGNTKPFEGLL